MISPDVRAMILDSTRAGVPLDGRGGSARAAGTTVAEVHAAMADPSEEGRAFAREMAAASEEGAAAMVAASRPATWASVAAVSAAKEERPAQPASDTGAGDRWAKIHREAAELAPGPFGYFLWVDAACIASGMPAASPWWRYSIGRLYSSGKMWGIFDVGRGGGKSTTLEKVAGDRALFAPRRVPPGQVWTWPFISVGPDDANRRVDGLAAVFRACGLAIIGEESAEGERQKEGVKITRAPRGSLSLVDAAGNPIQLGSIAGTIGNVSGPSTIGMTIDEGAKLHDKTANANPLPEILASGAQTSRGRPGWQSILSSSSWDRAGTFWQLVEQGDNDSNFVARIGEPFLDAALRGFEIVAAWEESGGIGRPADPRAAATIREHARTLTAASAMIPTWVAHPGFGNPDGVAWEGAALATRRLVDVLPEKSLGGVPRVLYWLRENGSLPMQAGGAARGSTWTAEDWAAHLEAMRGMQPARVGETDFARLHFDPFGGGEVAAPARYRGL